jgi:mersacidin/lichenicidin family type 2 lantibiotic
MSQHDIIRAWKDEDYRNSLSEAQRAQLPAHPAGLIELTTDELDLVAGAESIITNGSWQVMPVSFECCTHLN